MIQLKTPTNEQFTAATQQLQAFVQAYDSQLTTKKGSVVRELLVRPCAYIYAGIKNALDAFVQSTSIATLIASQATQDQLADNIASNYFTQRIQGKRAKGTITIVASTPTVRISANTVFMVDSEPFVVEKTILVTGTQTSGDSGILYIAPRQLSDGTYLSSIPVVAQNQGYIELAKDSEVTTSTNIPGVLSIQLSSPITGGGSTQTNAQMFTRIKMDYTSASDNSYAISRLLKQAPVPVLSSASLMADNPSMFRARNNNLQLSIGGMVDVFAKTQNQLQVTTVNVNSVVTGTTHKLTIDQQYTQVAGAIRVLSVALSDNTAIPDYTVEFTSSAAQMGAAGARLSSYQQIQISFTNSSASSLACVVQLSYMPGINDLQSYIDGALISIPGRTNIIKSAVPVQIGLDCCISANGGLSEDQLNERRQAIASIIRQYPVGKRLLNFSQLHTAFTTLYPDNTLSLPATIRAWIPTRTGDLYTATTDSGVFDLQFRQGFYYWEAQTCFFTSTYNNINLSVL